jgi:hypothetical protein
MKACQQLEDDFLGLAAQNSVCGGSEVCCTFFSTPTITQQPKEGRVVTLTV